MANNTKEMSSEFTSVKKILKSQSAFTLIEICIALLILSLSVAWTSELVVARIPSYQKAVEAEIAFVFESSAAEAAGLSPAM